MKKYITKLSKIINFYFFHKAKKKDKKRYANKIEKNLLKAQTQSPNTLYIPVLTSANSTYYIFICKNSKYAHPPHF